MTATSCDSIPTSPGYSPTAKRLFAQSLKLSHEEAMAKPAQLPVREGEGHKKEIDGFGQSHEEGIG